MFFSEIDFPGSESKIVMWEMIVTKINKADDDETNGVRYFCLSIDN